VKTLEEVLEDRGGAGGVLDHATPTGHTWFVINNYKGNYIVYGR